MSCKIRGLLVYAAVLWFGVVGVFLGLFVAIARDCGLFWQESANYYKKVLTLSFNCGRM